MIRKRLIVACVGACFVLGCRESPPAASGTELMATLPELIHAVEFELEGLHARLTTPAQEVALLRSGKEVRHCRDEVLARDVARALSRVLVLRQLGRKELRDLKALPPARLGRLDIDIAVPAGNSVKNAPEPVSWVVEPNLQSSLPVVVLDVDRAFEVDLPKPILRRLLAACPAAGEAPR